MSQAVRPRAVAAVAALVGLSLALPVPARAFVYWSDYGAGTIGRAKLDGSHANRAFITPPSSPFGMAIDDRHIYWTSFATGSIGRAKLDGTHVKPQLVTGASSPTGLAVDASHVYWANFSTGTIGRAG